MSKSSLFSRSIAVMLAVTLAVSSFSGYAGAFPLESATAGDAPVVQTDEEATPTDASVPETADENAEEPATPVIEELLSTQTAEMSTSTAETPTAPAAPTDEQRAAATQDEIVPMETGGYGCVLDSSQIGGVHPVNSGTSAAVAVSDSGNTSGSLNFKFPAGTTDGKIVVTMPSGVQWINPGGTNGVATVSALEGTTATYGGSGSGPYGGHYTYTVNANTTEFTLTNLLIKQHTFYAGRVANTPITVDTYYGGGTTPKDHVEFTSVDLQTLGICNSQINPTKTYFAPLDGTLPFGYVGDVAATGNFVPLVHVGAAHGDGALMDKIVVTVTPTAIDGTGDKTKAILHNDNSNWTMNGPDANGVYTFEMNNVFGVAYNAMTPQFHMEFPDTYFDLNDVITYNMAVSGVYVDGLPITTTADSSKDITVKLVEKDVKWSIGVKSLNEMINLGLINQAVVNTNEGEAKYSQFGTHDVSSGLIGNFYYGNYSGKDSDPTRAVFDFDTENIGVRSVVLPVPYKDADGDGHNDITMTNVTYTTNLNPTPRVYTTPIDTDSSNRVGLGPDVLGLADGEYVKTFSVDYSMIPGVTALGYFGGGPADAGIFGVVLKDGAHSESTVSLVDIASESVDITNKIISNTSDERGALSMFQPGTITKTAGTSGKFEFGLRADYWSMGSTPTPVTFIRNPMGLDFDLDSIRVYNDAGGVRTDIPLADCKVSSFNDSAGVQVIRVELPESGVGAINANEAENRANWWNVTINYHVPALSPGGTWDWDQILFMEDNVATHKNKASSATALAQELKDDNAGYILQANNTTSFNIEGRTDMVIDNAIKYTSAADSSYTTFSKDGAHLILDAPTSVDLKMSIYNNTGTAGVVSSGSAIYMPIPKTGDNWGSMMNASYPAFQFSTELTAEIPNPDSARYTILYGSVTPSDSKTSLESYTFEAWNAANAASYNCVKVVQNTDWAYSAADATRDFVMTLKLTANDTLADDQFDVWAPAYNERYTGNAGSYELWKNGEYSALVTALGQIMGHVWLDENLDGVEQATETTLPTADKAGWDVKVYEKADYDTNGVAATTVGSAVTDGDGKYFIDKLDRSTEYVLTASKAGTDYYFTTPITAAYGKANNSFSGASAATSGVSGAATATADKATRKVADAAVNTDGLGIYPIGVRVAQAKGATTPQDLISGATGQQGSTITYTIAYANTTASKCDVVIKDSTPTNTTFASATGTTTTVPTAGETGAVEWKIVDVEPGTSGSVTFTVKVNTDMTAATDITNKATVKPGNDPEVTTNEVKTNIPATTLAAPAATKAFSADSQTQPAAKTFSFDLKGSAGTEPMPAGTAVGGTVTKTTSGAGTAAAFGDITYTAAGTYDYTITEQTPSPVPAGYTYDKSEYAWTVTVTEKDGALSAAGVLTKTKDETGTAIETPATATAPTFTNKYTPAVTTVTASPNVTKTVSKNTPDEASTFGFVIAAGANNPVAGLMGMSSSKTISTKTNATEAAAFGNATFTKAGTYTFTITETAGTDTHYAYDKSEYTWTVKVNDNNGQLAVDAANTKLEKTKDATGTAIATPAAATAATFDNAYTPVASSWTPTVNKTVSGEPVPTGKEETFTFKLTGTGIAAAGITKTVTGTGSVSFDAINYTKAGTYNYQITEAAGANAGYTYDASVYDISVAVTDDKGTLNAVATVKKSQDKDGTALTPAVEATTIAFDNVYKPTGTIDTKDIDGNGTALFTKVIAGDNVPAGKQFDFTLHETTTGATTPDKTASYTTTAGDTGSHNVGFGAITYDKAGTYTYDITETTADGDGWTKSGSPAAVTVTVADEDGNGTLKVATSAVSITNTYAAAPAIVKIDPPITKTIAGDKPDSASTFNFKVVGNNNAPMPADATGAEVERSITGEGSVEIGEITYSTPGTYTYDITEVAGSTKGYTYDDAAYVLTVTITDKGDGTLGSSQSLVKAGATDEVTAAAFTNNYTAPVTPSGDVEVVKTGDKATVKVGDEIDYSITVTNKSATAAATGVWVKDYMPTGTEFVSCAGDQKGDVATDKTYVNWFFDTLAPSESKTITMKVKVANLKIGDTVTNTALYEVTGKTKDEIDFTTDPSGKKQVVSPTEVSDKTTPATTKAASTTAAKSATSAKTGDTLPLLPLGMAAVAAAAVVLFTKRKWRSR